MLRSARQRCDDVQALSTVPIERLRGLAVPSEPVPAAVSCFGGLGSTAVEPKGRFEEGGVGMPVVEVRPRSEGGLLEAARGYLPWLERREAREVRAKVAEEVVRHMNPDVYSELLAMMEPRCVVVVGAAACEAGQRSKRTGRTRVFRPDLMAYMDQ